jgi:periplasmic divalent cation tolerance protein
MTTSFSVAAGFAGVLRSLNGMVEKILLALSTFPDAETARRISNQLVTEKFAACANILPGVESIYRWEGKVETAAETLALFKLSEDRQSAFQEKLRSLHPYEVPEIIFASVSGGLPEYLGWVTKNCG